MGFPNRHPVADDEKKAAVKRHQKKWPLSKEKGRMKPVVFNQDL